MFRNYASCYSEELSAPRPTPKLEDYPMSGVRDNIIQYIRSYPPYYGPGVDSASNRNEYQVYFLRVKGGRCVRLTTLPPSYAVVMKCGNLNFLEPFGPLQACNGTAFTH